MGLDFRRQLNPRFNRIEWIVERFAWLLLALFLSAAVLGAFGNGLFSSRTLVSEQSGGRIALTYERIARKQSPATLRLEVSAPSQTAPSLTIALSPEFLDKVDVSSIIPSPDSVSFQEAGAALTWQVEDWSRPLLVSLNYQPQHWLGLHGEASVFAGNVPLGRVSFSQFILP